MSRFKIGMMVGLIIVLFVVLAPVFCLMRDAYQKNNIEQTLFDNLKRESDAAWSNACAETATVVTVVFNKDNVTIYKFMDNMNWHYVAVSSHNVAIK